MFTTGNRLIATFLVGASLFVGLPVFADGPRNITITAADADDDTYLGLADSHIVKYTIEDCTAQQPDGDCSGIWIDRVYVTDTVSMLAGMATVVDDIQDKLDADQRAIFAHEEWSVTIRGPQLAPGLRLYDPFYTLTVTPTDAGSGNLSMAWACTDSSAVELDSDTLTVSELTNKAPQDAVLYQNCLDAIYASVTVADLAESEVCFNLPVDEDANSGWAGPYLACYTPSDNGGNTDFTWTVDNASGTQVDTASPSYSDATQADTAIRAIIAAARTSVSASLTADGFPATFAFKCPVPDYGTGLLIPPYTLSGTAADNGANTDFTYAVTDGAGTELDNDTASYADSTQNNTIKAAFLAYCRTTIEAENTITDVSSASLTVPSRELPFVPTNAPIEVSACGTLSTANRTYQLTGNITSNSGDCIAFSNAQNVAFDLNGNDITYSDTGDGKAFVAGGTNYLRVYNGSITQGAWDPGSSSDAANAIGRNTSEGSFVTLVVDHVSFTQKEADHTTTSGNSIMLEGSSSRLIKVFNNYCELTGSANGSFFHATDANSHQAITIAFNTIDNNQTQNGSNRNGQGVAFTGVGSKPGWSVVANECTLASTNSQSNCFPFYQTSDAVLRDNVIDNNSTDRGRGILIDNQTSGNDVSYNQINLEDATSNCAGIRERSSSDGANDIHHNVITGAPPSAHGAFFLSARSDQYNTTIRNNTVTASEGILFKIRGEDGASPTGGWRIIDNTITQSGAGDAFQFAGSTNDLNDIIVQGGSITGNIDLFDTIDSLFFCNTSPTTPTLEGQVTENSGTFDYTIQAEDCYP